MAPQTDYSVLIILIECAALVLGVRWLLKRAGAGPSGVPAPGAPKQQVLVRIYKGSAESSAKAFHAEAVQMAQQGYFPVSQSYTPGAYSCGEFLVAVLLFIVLIGFIIFIYMLLVKPPGTLQVTYEFRQRAEVPLPQAQPLPATGVKICPRCAETIKEAALVCRYCAHEFGAPA